MPIYNKQGKIPAKRHTAFTKEDGSIYYEELVRRSGWRVVVRPSVVIGCVVLLFAVQLRLWQAMNGTLRIPTPYP